MSTLPGGSRAGALGALLTATLCLSLSAGPAGATPTPTPSATPAPPTSAPPMPERCNSMDDDGDGGIDETFPVGDACSITGADGCQTGGVLVCAEDEISTTCQANGPLSEADPETLGTFACFDGFDNDCDGVVDAADPDCQTPDEIGLCNGYDDDGDGSVDEDFPQLGAACSAGVGFCQRDGVMTCASDQSGVVCDAIAGSASTEASPGAGRCLDGVDNDCDGLTDLDDPGCQEAELCDGVDNDGDGAIDEDFADLGHSCGAGTGACQATGAYVCDALGVGTLCDAVALPPTYEGPGASSCSDGVDNDCDGFADGLDTGCASTDLAVRCALEPVNGNSGHKKPAPGVDCEGKFRLVWEVVGDADSVTAEILTLDEDGGLLGSLPVEQGDLAHLASRTNPGAYKLDDKGAFVDAFAPVPMLRVTASTSQRTAQAFCSPIPFLDLVAPAGEVVSEGEGDVVPVTVALPRVDEGALTVEVDGVDILAALGLDPALDFPGGPYGGPVTIDGVQATVSDLIVQTGALDQLSANQLTMTLTNLGAGGHQVRVTAAADDGALPDHTSAVCYLDDHHDSGSVSIFGIDILSPAKDALVVGSTVQVEAEIRHGRPIAGAEIMGIPVDVSGQTLLPGDGETTADEYVLSVGLEVPLSDLSLGNQPGTFDLGLNDAVVGAEDDVGSLAYARQRFAFGDTLLPGGLETFAADLRETAREAARAAAAEKAGGIALDNAIVFGLDPDGLQAFYDGVCDKVRDTVGARVREAVMAADLPSRSVSVDAACNPTVHFSVLSVGFNGELSCTVTPAQDQLEISVGLPDIIAGINAKGKCRDEALGICISEVKVDVDLQATLRDNAISFVVTEDRAREGGDSPADFIDGTVQIQETRSSFDINCIAGIAVDVLEVLTFGLVDLEDIAEDAISDKLNKSIDLQEALGSAGDDPLEIGAIGLDGDRFSLSTDLGFDQRLADLQITEDGLIGAISIELNVTLPDSELLDLPEATLTPADAPTWPISGAGNQLFVLSDDLFNLMYAGLTAQGALRADCSDSGLTVLDLLPGDCDALSGDTALDTARMKGRCKGAKGVDCATLSTDQRAFCATAQAELASSNISTGTGVLFCGRGEIGPRLLIDDDAATPDAVETRIHFNDYRVTVVLDRSGGGTLDGALATAPGCFTPLSDSAADCRWAITCFDLDVGNDLTLGQSIDGDPLIVPTVGAISGALTGVQCGGSLGFGINDDLLTEAGASDPVDIVGANLDALTPAFQADGLELGGFVDFGSPRLLAIDVGLAGQDDCPTCQEYVGITGDVSAE